ncbi:MAG: PQQ-dependent sugar dehydrogenase [Patescibacteria group bacterium]
MKLSRKILLLFGIIILGTLIFLVFQNKKAIAPPNIINNLAKVSPSVSQTKTDIPKETVIAQNLDTPWAIAFLPDGSLLVTERAGRIHLLNKNGEVRSIEFSTAQSVKEIGEGGLLGIVLHPDFSSNHYVYIYYTYSGENNNTLNRVSRFTLNDTKMTDEKIIVDRIPGASNHNGGRIKFGPDKLLYITTGDSQDPSLAQDRNSLAGKILRTTDEGKPASGNPFGNLTYSYGHRNPQGIAWDKNGNLWQTEHGRSAPTGLDEINLIEYGKNYGWDIIQGNETRSGMITPVRNSGPNTTWAPAGAAFVGGSLFFAGLRGQSLYEAVIENNQVRELKEHFVGQYGRLREVILGHDGVLYITTSNRDGRGIPKSEDDRIIRVNPAKL